MTFVLNSRTTFDHGGTYVRATGVGVVRHTTRLTAPIRLAGCKDITVDIVNLGDGGENFGYALIVYR